MHLFDRIRHFFLPSAHNAYRPYALHKRSLLFFLGALLVIEAGFISVLLLRHGGDQLLAAIIKSEIVSLTNTERAQKKVRTLRENPLLTASAQAKAEDMAAKSYFAHKGPDGKLPWRWMDEVGYQYQAAGENLAVRFVDSSDVVVAWMASPSHRANIVKATYTDIGVGIAEGVYKGAPATFVVQHFGRPMPSGLTQGSISAAAINAPHIESSASRFFISTLADPYASSTALIALVLAVLVAVLSVTALRHIQVQSHELLAPGAVVAAVALSLLFINAYAFAPLDGQATQSAAVVQIPDAAAMLGE